MPDESNWFETSAPLAGTVQEIETFLANRRISPEVQSAAASLYISSRDFTYRAYQNSSLSSFLSERDMAVVLFEISALAFRQMELYMKHSFSASLNRWEVQKVIDELWLSLGVIFVDDAGVSRMSKILLNRRASFETSTERGDPIISTAENADQRVILCLRVDAIEICGRVLMSNEFKNPPFSFYSKDYFYSYSELERFWSNGVIQVLCDLLERWFWIDLAALCNAECASIAKRSAV